MDHSASEQRDLESGGTGSEIDPSRESISSKKPARTMNVFGRLRSEYLGFQGYGKDECSSSTNIKSRIFCEVSYQNKDFLIDKDPEQGIERLPPLLEKKHMKEKRKISIQKASKPPRPPKGPTLDVLDSKLVTEMSELSMKRRARIKRIKALKKMKAKIESSSSSSSSSSLTCSLAAMVATLLFLILIFFQGFLSRHNSNASFKGSPEPAAVAHDLISVRLLNNTPVSGGNAASSIFSKLYAKAGGASR